MFFGTPMVQFQLRRSIHVHAPTSQVASEYRSKQFDENLRTAPPVVEITFAFGQPFDRGVQEAALAEPVRGAGRQHEQAIETDVASDALDMLQ